MFPVKENFKNNHLNDLNCKMCKIEICNQEHLLSCVVLRKFLPELETTNVKYEDLFGSSDKQLEAAKLFMKISNHRETILEALK